MDEKGTPYLRFYANPISDGPGYSNLLQLETAKFKAVTSNRPDLGENTRPIKIGNNYAFKFFYLKTAISEKWYVILNFQVMKNWFWGNSKQDAKNLEMFGIDPNAMWLDPNAKDNISNNPGNNNVTLRFQAKYVKTETKDQLELNDGQLIKISDPWKDPIVKYLRMETFGLDALKAEGNQLMFDGIFAFFGW